MLLASTLVRLTLISGLVEKYHNAIDAVPFGHCILRHCGRGG